MDLKAEPFHTPLSFFGAHFSACPVEIREFWSKLVSDAVQRKQFWDQWKKHSPQTQEMVILTTCNRFDLVALGPILSPLEMAQGLCKIACAALEHGSHSLPKELASQVKEAQKLLPFMRHCTDVTAMGHLMAIASSLDSLVVGEPHILGQVKNGLHQCFSEGICGSKTIQLFNKIFAAAKRVRAETDIGKNSISVAHAAIEASRRVREDTIHSQVLVVGAGEMSKIILQNLKEMGLPSVTLTNRSAWRAQSLLQTLQTPRFEIQFKELESALEDLHKFNLIFVATASTEPIILPHHTLSWKKRSKSNTPLVIVDICVPRNVDPEVGQQESLFLFDIDDLDSIMGANRQARMEATQAARVIIQQELDSFLKHHQEKQKKAGIARLHQQITREVQKHILKRQGKDPTKPLSSQDIKLIAQGVAKSLVHVALAQSASDPQKESP